MKLRWPIKESFQGYVRGAAGTIEVSDDVTHEGVDFVFPEAEITDTTWSFSGHVDMNAHGGFLAVIIADPIITWEGDNGVISVRTGHNTNACNIARRLGGGGHPRAAGCEISGNPDNAEHAILEEVKKELDRADAEKEPQ